VVEEKGWGGGGVGRGSMRHDCCRGNGINTPSMNPSETKNSTLKKVRFGSEAG